MILRPFFRDAGKILEKALLGKEGHTERWRQCVADTDSALGFALGAMFVRQVFHGESKQEAQKMIDAIKKAFERRLKSLSWMDKETQNAALIKAQAITDMIGYPSFIENPEDLDKKYENLNISLTDFFGNSMASHTFTFYDNMRKLDKEVNRTKWSMTPPTVNAYYTPTKNQIVFPAGIMQSPFFNVKYPKSINFGAMGVVMGHELSHAFDDQVRILNFQCCQLKRNKRKIAYSASKHNSPFRTLFFTNNQITLVFLSQLDVAALLFLTFLGSEKRQMYSLM